MSEPIVDATAAITPEAGKCTPSVSVDVEVSASPGTQVQVGTTVQLTGVAKGIRILPSCEEIEKNVPFQWSLSFQAPGGPVIDITSSLQGAHTLGPSFLANADGTFWAVLSAGNATFGEGTAEVVITATLPPPVLVTVSGHVTSLRANDPGDGPDDFTEVEAVVQLDTQQGKNFGFQLRNDKNRPARQSMFDLLLSAFNNNWTVSLDCLIVPGKNNGRILQATLTKAN